MISCRRLCAVAIMSAALGGCGADADGVGTITVDDLDIVVGAFGDEAALTSAQLSVQDGGCVAAIVDGTARFVFWPPGTTSVNLAADPDTYEMHLSNGTVLRASQDQGDSFTAEIVQDDSEQVPMRTADGTDYEKIGIAASFCDLEGPAIAIWDADTVSPA